MDETLLHKFERMRQIKGLAYKPRTRHLKEDGSAKYTNRLFLETSPYLLQHAHNPVNWYPWGEEAFAEAKKRDVPLFVSIGYATCHWCHVMEEESFEDEEIAEQINKHFVAVKVDREERPDVDSIYMKALQVMGLGGGWPLNVWLTQDLKPFYGGTYFPARDGDRGAATGFLTLLQQLDFYYHEKRDVVKATGNKVADYVNRMAELSSGDKLPDGKLLIGSIEGFMQIFDGENGGVKGAPKFPSSMPVPLLLRYYRRSGDKQALAMAEISLKKMGSGGIHDQAGGGFHRYTVDGGWQVPHFEKMLYDNALISSAFLDGYQATGDKFYSDVVESTLDYILRDMTSPGGGFYSATDADSLTHEGEMEEGFYFTWTIDEVNGLLDKQSAEVVKFHYGISAKGNFEGRNILNVSGSEELTAEKFGISTGDVNRILSKADEALLNARNKRPLPIRDEKIISSWNGLMISSFARAGFVLNNPKYIRAAEQAAGYLLEKLHYKERLYRTFKDEQRGPVGVFEDYAFLEAALLDLFEVTWDFGWLKMAIKLDSEASKLFEDKDAGGFFMTSVDKKDLITREKNGQDGAIPSGNSVAAMNLLRLSSLTGDDYYGKRARNLLKAFEGKMKTGPQAYSEMMLAVDYMTDMPREVVIIHKSGMKSGSDKFLEVLRKLYLPNMVVVGVDEDEVSKYEKILPILHGKKVLNGKPTVYVCEKGQCMLPVFDDDDLKSALKKVKEF